MSRPALARARRAWRTWRARRIIARSGLFDRAWYERHYPDVAEAGLAPILHYVLHGHAEGFFPNPIFDSRWYRNRYMSASGADANTLVDYIAHVGARCRNPNRWFDVAWYRSRNGVAARDPMRHYLSTGAAHGFETGPDLRLADFAGAGADLGEVGTPLGYVLHHVQPTGCIGDCTSYFVAGWAHRRAADMPLVLAVHVNGVEQGRVTPWLERPDVVAALGIAGLGYFFSFPTRLRSGDVVEIRDELDMVVEDCRRTYLVPPLGAASDFYGARAAIAAAFLHGRGVEVGAFHSPTDLPPDREIVFYDRFPTEVLREHYDETGGRPLMEPSLIGEAETLDGLADGVFDFLIANHVIEHLQDPIRFLRAVAAKLAPGGRAMIAAPDKRYTFDSDRALTPFAHLVEDHERGAQVSQYGHFLEWAEVGLGLRGDAAHAAARATDTDTTLFHYHVWDADSFVDFVTRATRRFALPLTLVHSAASPFDITVVLEKTG